MLAYLNVPCLRKNLVAQRHGVIAGLDGHPLAPDVVHRLLAAPTDMTLIRGYCMSILLLQSQKLKACLENYGPINQF